MAVSSSFTPPALSPVRSPLWTRITSDTYAPAPYTQVKAQFSIHFNTGVANSDSIVITTGLGSVEMICTALDQDGLHFDEGANGTDAAIAFMAGCLQNYLLTTNYIISRIGVTVYFTARYPGAKYNLDEMICSPGGLATAATIVTGIDGSYTGNYSIIVRPWIQDGSGAFFPVGEFQCVPDQLNGISFDLSKVLRGAWRMYNGLDLEPDWPVYGFANALLHTKSTRAYYLEYYARFGRPPVTQGVQLIGSSSSPRWAWLAGWERREYQTFHLTLNRWLGLTGAPHLFHTYRNRGEGRRFVTLGEQHYLALYHWPMQATPDTFNMEAQLVHLAPNGTDPQTVTWTSRYAIDTASDWPRGRVATFATGYTQLNIGALLPVGRVPYSYSVRVVDLVTGPKSEEITFYIAPRDENDVFLQFWSSLGAVESLRAKGAWIRTKTPEYEELMRELTVSDLTVQDRGAYFSEPLGAQAYLDVTIASPNQWEHDCVLDILGSLEIRRVDPTEGGRYEPLRLVRGEEVTVQQKGTEDENVRLLRLVLAVDDPQALITKYITGGTVTANEDDGISPEDEGGGGGGGEEP